MLNKMLFLLAICCASLLSCTNAQNYLPAGTTHTFTALNADGTKDVTLSVVFDKEGIATVSRTEAAPTDKSRAAFYFLTKEEAHARYGDDKSATVNIEAKNGSDYTYISFDGEILGRASSGAAAVSATISCICTSKLSNSGTCDVLYIGNNASSGCLSCTSTTCSKCEVDIKKSQGNISTSTLLIQAKEVRFANK